MFLASFNYTGIAVLSSFFGAIATILARTLLKALRARDIMGINFEKYIESKLSQA